MQSKLIINSKTQNILKNMVSKYHLSSQDQAVEIAVEMFRKMFLSLDYEVEPELRPEFIEKINKLKEDDYVYYDSVDELDAEIRGLNISK